MMKTHVMVVAVLHLIFSGIGLIVGLVVGAMLALGGALSGDETATMVMSGVGVFLLVLFLVLSIPGLIGAFGTLKGRNWGRIILIIVGIFNLPGIPIGTALGIYTLWTMFHEETRAMFEGSRVTG